MFGLTVLSMIFAYVGLIGCEFVLIAPQAGFQISSSDSSRGYGFYHRMIYDVNNKKTGCLAYEHVLKKDYLSDSAWKAGRAFGILTAMIMTINVMLLGMVLLFVHRNRLLLWRLVKALLIVTFLTQLFTFSVFASDVCKSFQDIPTTCQAGSSSKIAAVNVFVLLSLIVISFLVPPPSHPMFRRWDSTYPTDLTEHKHVISTGENLDEIEILAKDTSLEDYEDTELRPYGATQDSNEIDTLMIQELGPDGRRTTKEITHPDGSKTVTETIETVLEEDDDDVYRGRKHDEVDV